MLGSHPITTRSVNQRMGSSWPPAGSVGHHAAASTKAKTLHADNPGSRSASTATAANRCRLGTVTRHRVVADRKLQE